MIFDTNMILRYLLNDNQLMADQAEKYLDAGEVSVTVEVIAEVVYVLHGVYSMERGIIADTLKKFLNIVDCRDKKVLDQALDTFGKRKLDFVDCVLYGYHQVRGAEIATFDRKLQRLLVKGAAAGQS